MFDQSVQKAFIKLTALVKYLSSTHWPPCDKTDICQLAFIFSDTPWTKPLIEMKGAGGLYWVPLPFHPLSSTMSVTWVCVKQHTTEGSTGPNANHPPFAPILLCHLCMTLTQPATFRGKITSNKGHAPAVTWSWNLTWRMHPKVRRG